MRQDQQTLAQWLESQTVKPEYNVMPGSRVVAIPYVTELVNRSLLWHLTDYFVSSVSGGSIWLLPKDQSVKTDGRVAGNVCSGCSRPDCDQHGITASNARQNDFYRAWDLKRQR